MRGRGLLLVLFCLSACAACGGSAGPPADPFSLKIAEDGKGYDLSTGEYLPPLEGGRLEVAPPADWNIRSPTSDYLAKFDTGGTMGIPRVDLTMEPSPYEEFPNLTKDNVVDFAKLRFNELLATDRVLLEPPKPMIIGGLPCVRYVVAVKAQLRVGPVDAERQIIETINDQELYSVNLLIVEGEILKHRDAAYAVASSLKFHKVEGGTSVFGSDPDKSDVPEVPKLEDVPGAKAPGSKSNKGASAENEKSS